MNNPNPLVPQGSLPQGAPGKFNIRLVVFGIIAVHAVFFCGLLIQGCKPKEDPKPKAPETTSLPPLPVPTDTVSTSAVPPLGGLPTAPATPTPETGLPTAPATGLAPMTSTSAPVTAPIVTPMPVAPTVPDTAPAMGATTEHVVTKGETFSSIAKKLHVPVSAITKANPNVDPAKLKIGTKLQVPAGSTSTAVTTASTTTSEGSGTTYVVKSGDNLDKIAKKHGTTVKALRALNGLKSDRINVGTKLKVPAKGGAAPSTPPADTAPGLGAPGGTPVVPATTPGARP